MARQLPAGWGPENRSANVETFCARVHALCEGALPETVTRKVALDVIAAPAQASNADRFLAMPVAEFASEGCEAMINALSWHLETAVQKALQ